MKKTLLLSFILLIFSCNKKNETPDNGENSDHSYIQEIGRLYKAESIVAEANKNGSRTERKNYVINISNSDSLEKNSATLEMGAKNIAYLYKKHLLKNLRNPNKIIIKINLRNGSVRSFEFEEEKLLEFETENK